MDTAVVLNRSPAVAHGHAEVGIGSVIGTGYDMVSGNEMAVGAGAEQ